ncbi:hypothetical protein B0H15DRAFT_410246 [Mycena belliarum]|uniref:Uncharacterized protein n=1 Tax=Mycena belliarum TaxID=1033014 RepID=A0AAD6XYC6_9AGAR|nr:hypothetical protein B0H15DRAFT_410246 [Mycena belliae]
MHDPTRLVSLYDPALAQSLQPLARAIGQSGARGHCPSQTRRGVGVRGKLAQTQRQGRVLRGDWSRSYGACGTRAARPASPRALNQPTRRSRWSTHGCRDGRTHPRARTELLAPRTGQLRRGLCSGYHGVEPHGRGGVGGTRGTRTHGRAREPAPTIGIRGAARGRKEGGNPAEPRPPGPHPRSHNPPAPHARTGHCLASRSVCTDRGTGTGTRRWALSGVVCASRPEV